MDTVKSPGDIVFDNFGAGGIKSHSKTPLIQLCTFPKGHVQNSRGRFGWGILPLCTRTVGASGGVGWGYNSIFQAQGIIRHPPSLHPHPPRAGGHGVGWGGGREGGELYPGPEILN